MTNAPPPLNLPDDPNEPQTSYQQPAPIQSAVRPPAFNLPADPNQPSQSAQPNVSPYAQPQHQAAPLYNTQTQYQQPPGTTNAPFRPVNPQAGRYRMLIILSVVPVVVIIVGLIAVIAFVNLAAAVGR